MAATGLNSFSAKTLHAFLTNLFLSLSCRNVENLRLNINIDTNKKLFFLLLNNHENIYFSVHLVGICYKYRLSSNQLFDRVYSNMFISYYVFPYIVLSVSNCFDTISAANFSTYSTEKCQMHC